MNLCIANNRVLYISSTALLESILLKDCPDKQRDVKSQQEQGKAQDLQILMRRIRTFLAVALLEGDPCNADGRSLPILIAV